MPTAELYILVLLIAALVLFRSARDFYRPITGNGGRMLLPLVFMLPGVYLILNPNAQATGTEWLAAVAIGIAMSLPLIWTTQYEVRSDNQIYAKRNKWFIVSFLIILAVRFGLRDYFSKVDSETLSALFILAAFSYVIPWRIASFIKYRRALQSRVSHPFSG